MRHQHVSRVKSMTIRLCLGMVALIGSVSGHAVAAAEPGSIGLVITGWHHALQQTPGIKAECPAGLNPDDTTNARAQPNFQELRNKYGHPFSRGPNGELSSYSPLSIQDPIPFSELQTKTGYGLNLDGTTDGRATARSCKHEKFTSPEGEQVDNQMARVVGCTFGWRKSGFSDEFFNEEIYNNPINRILIEVTGVGDERNDPAVEVQIYKGRDRLVRDPAGQYIPFLTQRVDEQLPEYVSRTRGKIVDGVLITEAIPRARLPLRWIAATGERRIRDLQLRITLDGTHPSGLLAGYEDVKIWWNMQKAHSIALPAGKQSPASEYRALHRYADGYPDPQTGQCTAISAAYHIETVRAFIAHPAGAQQPMRVANREPVR
jgi:hypothetical protein